MNQTTTSTAKPQATAQKAAAKPPPVKAPPPKPSGGGIGCLPILILIALVSAACALVYYFPQQAENITGIKLPAFIPTVKTESATDTTTQADKPATSMTDTTLSVALPASLSAAEESEQSRVNTRLQQLQQQNDNAEQQIQQLKVQLVRNEQQVARLSGQVADINRRQTSTDLHLQVIALQLQLSGEPTQAAEALQQLASTTKDTTAARAMLDETARLNDMVARSVLLQILDEIKTINPTDTPLQADGMLAKLLQLFNVRHTPSAAPLPLAHAKLAQLELMLLTQREDTYWLLLQQMRADGVGNQQVQNILQRLHDYGAPDYRLRLTQF